MSWIKQHINKKNKITIIQDIVQGVNTITHNLNLIGIHSAAGAGLGFMFTKVGTVWYRF